MSLNENLGRANVAIRATLDQIDGDMAAAKTKIDGAAAQIAKTAGDSLKAIGTAALAGIGAAGAAVAGVGTALAKLTIDAAPVEGLANAFEGLAESAGMGADEMLAALSKGGAGMIANRDLMMSFNQAASLVSLDFATQLPDAMQYLSKVSASTGQDMGFLLDSLVKGVGRVSPMILDNLGIQVGLAEATDRAAAMFGVEADSLDKAQIQAGMMEVVLEKLAANTAAMPDVTESAAAKMAQMKATFQNTKDQIGMAFLPVLSTVLTVLSDLAARALPYVTMALDAIAPVAQTVAAGIQELVDLFFWTFEAGGDLEMALRNVFDLFMELIGVDEETRESIWGIINTVQDFITTAFEAVAPIIQWISENVSLQDILIALGAAIATVVLPALWGVIAAAAPIVATFLAVVAVAALLRTAWENDWLGIRTALTEAWTNTILPALQMLWQWLSVNVPLAIETLKTFWTETLLPALQTFWSWVQTTVFPLLQTLWNWLAVNVPVAIEALKSFWTETLLPALQSFWTWVETTVFPLLQTLWDWLATNVPEAIETLKTFWTETLMPALEDAWAWIEANLIPLFEAIGELFNVTLSLAITALAGLWEKVLLPALEAAWKFIQESVLPVLQQIADKVSITLKPILEGLSTFLSETWTKAWEGISGAIEDVIGWIKELTDKIANVKLPDWLTPGSPTPFELGLRGIANEMRGLSSIQVPQLSQELGGLYGGEALSRNDAGAPAGGGKQVVIYGLTLEGVQDANGLLGELQALT